MKLNRRQNAVVETLNQINNIILDKFEDMVVSEVKISHYGWDNSMWLESRELDVRIRFTFTKREVYVIAVYNIRGYITHEGCILEKYSSKNRKEDIKNLLNALLGDLIYRKCCKCK